MPGMATSIAHELVQVAAHQRLAAGQPNLVDAERRRDADEVRDLLEGEQLVLRPERDILRHAVRAAQIAPVGDGDAQVVVDPAEGVDERSIRTGP